jgi:MFS family permease
MRHNEAVPDAEFANPQPTDEPPVRYRELFSNREFASLWLADVFSGIGSQIGRLAIAALVFDRTGSAGLTAAAFAITYLPHLLGGAVLASLADRWPRRETLIGADVVRAALTLAILLPGMPLLLALALVFLVELVSIPFGAARLATLADVLDRHRFAAGNSLVTATQQILLVAGFASGGVLVALIGARASLAVDALSYVVSAGVLVIGVRRRPSPLLGHGRRRGLWHDTLEGLRIVRTTSDILRNIVLLLLGPSVLNVTIALAVPYAAYLGGGTMLAGIMMAAPPLGSSLGLLWVGRLPEPRRLALAAPSVVGLGLAVAATGVVSHAAVVTILLFVAGLTLGYLTTVQAAIAAATPVHARGRVFGLANTGMQLGQGVAVGAAAVLTTFVDLRTTLILAGLTGAGLAAGTALLRRRRLPTAVGDSPAA